MDTTDRSSLQACMAAMAEDVMALPTPHEERKAVLERLVDELAGRDDVESKERLARALIQLAFSLRLWKDPQAARVVERLGCLALELEGLGAEPGLVMFAALTAAALGTDLPPETVLTLDLLVLRLLPSTVKPDEPGMLMILVNAFLGPRAGKAKHFSDEHKRRYSAVADCFWSYQRRYGPDDPRLIPLILSLTMIDTMAGLDEFARIHLAWARDIADRKLCVDDELWADIYRQESVFEEKFGDEEEAVELMERACEIMEAARGRDSLEALKLRESLADLHIDTNYLEDAAAVLSRMVGDLERRKNDDPDYLVLLVESLEKLRDVCEQLEHPAQAEQHARRLAKLRDLYQDALREEDENDEGEDVPHLENLGVSGMAPLSLIASSFRDARTRV